MSTAPSPAPPTTAGAPGAPDWRTDIPARRTEVSRYAAQGMSARAIAGRLGVGKDTVRRDLEAIEKAARAGGQVAQAADQQMRHTDQVARATVAVPAQAGAPNVCAAGTVTCASCAPTPPTGAPQDAGPAGAGAPGAPATHADVPPAAPVGAPDAPGGLVCGTTTPSTNGHLVRDQFARRLTRGHTTTAADDDQFRAAIRTAIHRRTNLLASALDTNDTVNQLAELLDLIAEYGTTCGIKYSDVSATAGDLTTHSGTYTTRTLWHPTPMEH